VIDRVDLGSVGVSDVEGDDFDLSGSLSCDTVQALASGTLITLFTNTIQAAVEPLLTVGLCRSCGAATLAVCPAP
jgi:hypothetical protein